MLIGIEYTFWLLKQWHCNQVQKLALCGHLLNFTLGLWFDLVDLVTFKYNFLFEIVSQHLAKALNAIMLNVVMLSVVAPLAVPV